MGLQVSQAIKCLSERKLNMRIIAEKEDLDLPEGTIVSQKPSPQQPIKPHQAIFVAISKKPLIKQSPDLLGKTIDQVKTELHRKGIKYKELTLQFNTPQNIVAAQNPAPNKQLNGPIYLYKATPQKQKVIFPSLKNRNWEEVKSFFERYNINPVVTYKNKCHHNDYMVIEQRPLAGTLVSLKQPLHVQLHLSAT